MPVTIGGSGPITGVTSINTTVSDTELGYLDGVTSAIQSQLAGKADTSGNGAWTSWTPTLTTGGTNPTLGTGSSATGKYLRLGNLVIARFFITFGTSGVAAGSGTYRVSLPINSAAHGEMSGSLFLYDSSAAAGTSAGMFSYDAAASYVQMLYPTATTTYSVVSNSAPWTWAASDQIRGFFYYEAA